jgi:hypothetical protein
MQNGVNSEQSPSTTHAVNGFSGETSPTDISEPVRSACTLEGISSTSAAMIAGGVGVGGIGIPGESAQYKFT